MRGHIFIMHERLESSYYVNYAQVGEVMPNSTAETTTRTATQTRFAAFGETFIECIVHEVLYSRTSRIAPGHLTTATPNSYDGQ